MARLPDAEETPSEVEKAKVSEKQWQSNVFSEICFIFMFVKMFIHDLY